MPRRAMLTDDPRRLFAFAHNAASAGHRIALVTLTEVFGTAARTLGAQMVVLDDGRYCGFVSGGCTESAVAAEALVALKSRHDRILRLGANSPFFDIVLPCGGGITLKIHVVRDMEVFAAAQRCFDERQCFSLLYSPGSEKLELVVGESKPTGWFNGIFVRHYRPATRLIVCGRSIELDATARLALAGGYGVECHGPETEELIALKQAGAEIATAATPSGTAPLRIDADTAVVLLFHDLEWELPFLRQALAAKPFYLGALGSGRTHAIRSEKLRDLGFSAQDLNRIKAPIGLFGPARDSNTLALSILADIAQAGVTEL